MAEAALLRTAQLLQVPVTEIAYCPHQAHPIVCYCRKPMPGLGVYLMERHRLARQHLVMVGDMASDAAFAAGLGARYWENVIVSSQAADLESIGRLPTMAVRRKIRISNIEIRNKFEIQKMQIQNKTSKTRCR